MATSLLELPTELLDRIFTCLDWDRSTSLQPVKDDIFSVSLTCKRLRQAILPIAFRDVTLRLRWTEGTLIEPSIYRLRRDRPHLAQHIRCVCIRVQYGEIEQPVEWHKHGEMSTKFVDDLWTGYQKRLAESMKLESFAASQDSQQWLKPAGTSSDSVVAEIDQAHAARVQESLHSLRHALSCTPAPASEQLTKTTALRPLGQEGITDHNLYLEKVSLVRLNVRQQRESENLRAEDLARAQEEEEAAKGFGEFPDYPRHTEPQVPRHDERMCSDQERLRLKLDALVVTAACLPATLTSLVVRTLPKKLEDNVQHNFALQVAAAAFELVGDRIRALSTITMPVTRDIGADREDVGDQRTITNDTIAKLTKLETLVLAGRRSETFERHLRSSMNIELQQYARWHKIAHCITRLELWHVSGSTHQLISILKPFAELRTLKLYDVQLAGNVGMRSEQRVRWLDFFILVRRSLPAATLELDGFASMHGRGLPSAARRFLLLEAVPTRALIDFQREQRLHEDFESFLPMWDAEEAQPKVAINDFAALADAAMSSRWKGF